MIVDQHIYRKAFQAYLRKGTPIMWSIKQERPTTHYIWRTQGDGQVRPSHAANDGKIFAWDDPPSTGHPGEDYGCRCTAEPYFPEVSEFVEITLKGISGGGAAWSSEDFVRHYFKGNGRGVTVRETGHLSAIVSQYMAEVESRLKNQIANEARKKRNGSFTYPFENVYGMTGVVFSVGDTVIGGEFSGAVKEEKGTLVFEGSFEFYLKDEFIDPLDIGVEVVDPVETIFENIDRPLKNYIRERVGLPPAGPYRPGIHTGEPYPITDNWSGALSGQIYVDSARSTYG